MKKRLLGAGLMLLMMVFGSTQLFALDTVVVGQPYYGYGGGYYGGYYGGGFAPGFYPGAGGYYGNNPNPAFGAVGGNPYFLGANIVRAGAATPQQVGRGLRQAETILNAPVPGNYNYDGAYIGGDPNVFNGPLVNYDNGVYY